MSEQNIEKEQLYKGVFRAEKKDGTVYYRASLTKNGKHISLGSFPDALQAHRAYEQGLLLLSDPSLTLQSYEKGVPFVLRKMGQSDQSAGQRTIHRQSDLSGTAALLLLFVPPPCLKIRHGRPVLLFFP